MKFDALIIGTGQSGPSLAGRCVKEGMKVAVLERKDFGGSCVNYGCTPTKTLVASAKVAHQIRNAAKYGFSVSNFSVDMPKVKKRKDEIVSESTKGLEKWLRSLKNCTVIKGQGVFEGPNAVRVNNEVLEADKIFINVGCRANIPEIPNLKQIPYYTNSSILELDIVPEHILIIGGGYIALEFAQIYRRLGSKVTIFQRHERVMVKEDRDVSEAIQEILRKEGIEILTNVKEIQIHPESKEGKIRLVAVHNGNKKEVQGSHLLLATGRVPNTEDLNVSKAQVKLDQKGFIQVNDELKTTNEHIWAIGDCNGRGAFTHTSYNDFEIVAENLFENGRRKVTDRVPIYALYTDPPMGRVGKTAINLKEDPHVLMAKMPMARVARAREMGETDGFLKIFVNEQSKLILGAVFLGVHCDEVIQTIADVMYAKAPYTVIQKGVHIHPTVMELVPTLLSELKPIRELAGV